MLSQLEQSPIFQYRNVVQRHASSGGPVGIRVPTPTGQTLLNSPYEPLEKGPEPCYSGRCAGCGMLLVSAVRPIARGAVCGRHGPGRRPDVA